MRKTLMFILGIIIISFIIPIFFTDAKMQEVISSVTDMNGELVSNQEQAIEQKQEQVNAPIKYEYSKYNTIKLLHSKTNEIQEVNLDEYLLGVVSAEMPANFEIEALKAQALVARTYTIYTIIQNVGKHGDANICDSSACCQAWISKEDRMNRWEEAEREGNWNKITEAVNTTVGKIITYNGEPINAFFHSNSGGTTEIPLNVWGGSGYPYLQVVEISGEENYSQYASEAEVLKDELISKIKEKHNEIVIDWESEKPVEILEYTDSGRVRTVRFGNVNLSGVETRNLLGLRSANFNVEVSGEKVKFTVKGYGHGVGLSQTGSDSLAKQGKNYEEIVKHFYQGIEIVNY